MTSHRGHTEDTAPCPRLGFRPVLPLLLEAEAAVWQRGQHGYHGEYGNYGNYDEEVCSQYEVFDSVHAALLRHGRCVVNIHSYFSNLQSRKCCLNLAAPQTTFSNLRVVSQNQDDVIIDAGSAGACVQSPFVDKLSEQDFEVYSQTLFCALFPVLGVPGPPADTPTLPCPQSVVRRQPYPDPGPDLGLTLRCDEMTSVIPPETLCDLLRCAFKLSHQRAAKYERLVLAPHKKKTHARVLVEELSSQFSLMENDKHTYYSPRCFLTREAYDQWKHQQRRHLGALISKFWYDSLPSLKPAGGPDMAQHHNQYRQLLGKLMRCEAALRGQDITSVLSAPLSSASRRLLQEFALRYGVGEMTRHGIYLAYLADHFETEVWFIRHVNCHLAAILHTFPANRTRVIMVHEEYNMLYKSAMTLHDRCQHVLTRMTSLYTGPEQPAEGIGCLIELLTNVLELKAYLLDKHQNPVRDFLLKYVKMNVSNLYNRHKTVAMADMKLDPNSVPTPALVSRLIAAIRDDLNEYAANYSRIFARYFDLVALCTQCFYIHLMDDVAVLSDDAADANVKLELDLRLLSLAYRLSQLDMDWHQHIPLRYQTWRRAFRPVVLRWLSVLRSHCERLTMQTVGTDKFSGLELHEVSLQSSLSSRPPSAGAASLTSLTSLTPSQGSAFDPVTPKSSRPSPGTPSLRDWLTSSMQLEASASFTPNHLTLTQSKPQINSHREKHTYLHQPANKDRDMTETSFTQHVTETSFMYRRRPTFLFDDDMQAINPHMVTTDVGSDTSECGTNVGDNEVKESSLKDSAVQVKLDEEKKDPEQSKQDIKSPNPPEQEALIVNAGPAPSLLSGEEGSKEPNVQGQSEYNIRQSKTRRHTEKRPSVDEDPNLLTVSLECNAISFGESFQHEEVMAFLADGEASKNIVESAATNEDGKVVLAVSANPKEQVSNADKTRDHALSTKEQTEPKNLKSDKDGGLMLEDSLRNSEITVVGGAMTGVLDSQKTVRRGLEPESAEPRRLGITADGRPDSENADCGGPTLERVASECMVSENAASGQSDSENTTNKNTENTATVVSSHSHSENAASGSPYSVNAKKLGTENTPSRVLRSENSAPGVPGAENAALHQVNSEKAAFGGLKPGLENVNLRDHTNEEVPGSSRSSMTSEPPSHPSISDSLLSFTGVLPVSGSLVDMTALLQRLVSFGRTLADTMYPVPARHDATVRSNAEWLALHEDGETLDSMEATARIDSLNARIQIYNIITQIAHGLVCQYADNLLCYDLCGTQEHEAARLVGTQLLRQVREQHEQGRVWGCRHMAHRDKSCFLFVDRKTRYLSDRYEPVTEEMSHRLNNVTSLLNMLPKVRSDIDSALQIEALNDLHNDLGTNTQDDAILEDFVVVETMPLRSKGQNQRSHSHTCEGHGCLYSSLSECRETETRSRTSSDSSVVRSRREYNITDVVFGHCGYHLQNVQTALANLIAYRVNLFSHRALSLLVVIGLPLVGIEERLLPVTSFLDNQVAALRTWLYDTPYELVLRKLWTHVAKVLEKETRKLISPRNYSKVQPEVLLQTIALFIKYFNRAGTGLPLHSLTETVAKPMSWLELYTESTPRLISLYRHLYMYLSDRGEGRQYGEEERTLLLKMRTELHGDRKCFSGRRFVDWFISQHGTYHDSEDALGDDSNISDDLRSHQEETATELGQSLLDRGILSGVEDGSDQASVFIPSKVPAHPYPTLSLDSYGGTVLPNLSRVCTRDSLTLEDEDEEVKATVSCSSEGRIGNDRLTFSQTVVTDDMDSRKEENGDPFRSSDNPEPMSEIMNSGGFDNVHFDTSSTTSDSDPGRPTPLSDTSSVFQPSGRHFYRLSSLYDSLSPVEGDCDVLAGYTQSGISDSTCTPQWLHHVQELYRLYDVTPQLVVQVLTTRAPSDPVAHRFLKTVGADRDTGRERKIGAEWDEGSSFSGCFGCGS